jgi:branched-subunit amino acid transport protein
LIVSAYTLGGIAGLTVITVLARGFFMLSERDLTLPGWAMQGLRFAPLAALVAVIAPEIVLTDGKLISTWADARIYAVLVATAYFWWRRGILGTIVSGTAVLLALNIGLGW